MSVRTWVGTTSGAWATTTNWLESTVPVTGDDVFFYNNSVPVTSDLDQHTVTLSSLTFDSSYTAQLAMPLTSSRSRQPTLTSVELGPQVSRGAALAVSISTLERLPQPLPSNPRASADLIQESHLSDCSAQPLRSILNQVTWPLALRQAIQPPARPLGPSIPQDRPTAPQPSMWVRAAL